MCEEDMHSALSVPLGWLPWGSTSGPSADSIQDEPPRVPYEASMDPYASIRQLPSFDMEGYAQESSVRNGPETLVIPIQDISTRSRGGPPNVSLQGIPSTEQKNNAQKSSRRSSVCQCADKLKDISAPTLKRFHYTLSMLADNWWSVAASVLGVSFGDLQNSKSTCILSTEKLDAFVASIISNPFPLVLETFLKCIQREFPVDVSLSEILSAFTKPLPMSFEQISAGYPSDRLVLPVCKRFLSSVVRQLSLSLSKNSAVDGSLRFKIGRHAKRKEENEEERVIKSIR